MSVNQTTAEVGKHYFLYDHWNSSPMTRVFRVEELHHQGNAESGSMTLIEVFANGNPGNPFSFPKSDFKSRFIPKPSTDKSILSRLGRCLFLLRGSDEHIRKFQECLVELEI